MDQALTGIATHRVPHAWWEWVLSAAPIVVLVILWLRNRNNH